MVYGLTEDIIKDIIKLRGKNVRVFGQPVTLERDYTDSLIIDVLDVLEGLKDYEISIDFNDIPETVNANMIINQLDYEGIIDKNNYTQWENTYNWMSPVSNDIDFKIYNAMEDGYITYIVILKVHRYGDVRGNYTEETVLQFDTLEEFYEVLTSYNIYGSIKIDNIIYYYNINIFSDEIEIETEENGYIFSICANDIEELQNEVKNKLLEE